MLFHCIYFRMGMVVLTYFLFIFYQMFYNIFVIQITFLHFLDLSSQKVNYFCLAYKGFMDIGTGTLTRQAFTIPPK